MVHGEAQSPGTPGCRSSHPLPWNHLLHLCLPSEVGHGDLGGVCHDGPLGGQGGEDPGLVEAQGKNDVELGLGVCSAAPQVVWAWPYGLQGSR